MAINVTTIGGGWDAVSAGTAEDVLRHILAAGVLSGEDVVSMLKQQGYAARGPAYYPPTADTGAIYALGNPHVYAVLDVTDAGPQWDLMNFDPSQAVTSPTPAPQWPAVLPVELVSALRTVVALVNAHTDAKIEEVKQQIDQVVKNAEKTGQALLPIVEAALPALGGLFAKK